MSATIWVYFFCSKIWEFSEVIVTAKIDEARKCSPSSDTLPPSSSRPSCIEGRIEAIFQFQGRTRSSSIARRLSAIQTQLQIYPDISQWACRMKHQLEWDWDIRNQLPSGNITTRMFPEKNIQYSYLPTFLQLYWLFTTKFCDSRTLSPLHSQNHISLRHRPWSLPEIRKRHIRSASLLFFRRGSHCQFILLASSVRLYLLSDSQTPLGTRGQFPASRFGLRHLPRDRSESLSPS